jgi:hypothetical protein
MTSTVRAAHAGRLASLPEVRQAKAGSPPFGLAEIGVAGVVVALAVTALTGTGLPLPSLSVADPMVWVPDSARGEVALVDPRSGRVEARVAAGEPGDDLEVAQQTGRFAVTNHRAGAVLMLDAGTLAVTGRRSAPGGEVRLLLTDAGALLVELEAGVVRRVDPSTVEDIGPPVELGRPIVDVAANAVGTLSLLLSGGGVHGVRWSAQSAAFEDVEPTAPVALADADRSTVVLLSDGILGGRPGGAGVIEVPVGGADCAHPWRPAIVGAVAYVSCLGAGQVLALTLAGQASGPPIDLPGSPQPVRYDGGVLLVAAEQAVLVPAGGAARSLRLFDPGVEVHALAGVR